MPAYKGTEEQAKAEWEALTPEEGTILWYDKWFAGLQDFGTPQSNPQYYTSVMSQMSDYEEERKQHNDDETWVEILKGDYEQALKDNA